MNFNEIIGQSLMVDSLKYIVAENKVANGYIFSGPKGCGKKLTASIFAKALGCKGNSDEKPCGVCNACVRFDNGNYPNLEIIRPTGASIKIKQIRQIISEVSKKAFESGYKVIILEQADKMTQDAQDAFLKTLEEPPADTVFILLVENHYALLPTVLSRCQIFQLKGVGNQDIENYLRNRFNVPDSQIKLATAYANGIIGRAVEIIQNEDYFKLRDTYISIIDQMFNGKYTAFSSLVNENLETRQDAEQFIGFLLTWFRDVMVLKEIPDNRMGLVTNLDKIDSLVRYGDSLSNKNLQDITEEVKKTAGYIKHNVSIKNCLDGMLLNIMEVCNGKNSRGKVQERR